MAIDIAGQTTVDPSSTTVVNNPNIDTTVVIPANTVMDDSGAEYAGPISVSPVPPAFTPGALPDTLNPDQVITVQPMGLTFDQPAPISFPNTSGLEAGSLVAIWSLDHDLGEFFVAGTGEVTSDGETIITIDGGIREASWHFPLPAQAPATNPNDSDGDNKPSGCGGNDGSYVSYYDGCLKTDVTVPGYVSLGQVRDVTFVYNSNRAFPNALIPFEVTIPRRSAVPDHFSYLVNFAGVTQGEEYFIDTSTLSESVDETIRGSVFVDGTELSTGVYWHAIRTNNYFGEASVSSDVSGRTIIVNEQNSPFGAGWTMAGLQRLYPQPDGRVLIADGGGSAQLFSPESLVNTPALFPQLDSIPVGNGPNHVELGDLNNDGNEDILTTNWYGDNVSVRLGDGTGAFGNVTEFWSWHRADSSGSRRF